MHQIVGAGVTLAILAISPASMAQSINIDYGGMFGTPGPAWPGPAGMPGQWNNVIMLAATPLVDLGGAATGVSIAGTGAGINGFNGPPPPAGPERFYDDWVGIGPAGTVQDFTIGPMWGGLYHIYTGAHSANPATITRVEVLGSPDPPLDVMGAWPGGHVLGVTHAHHVIAVAPGANIIVRLTSIAGYGRLNGLQIVD
jgi:hypothetical protein